MTKFVVKSGYPHATVATVRVLPNGQIDGMASKELIRHKDALRTAAVKWESDPFAIGGWSEICGKQYAFYPSN